MNTFSQQPQYRGLTFLLILLVTLANYHLYIGFALKPYMVLSIAYMLVFFGAFRFYRLQLFEVAMLLFYLLYVSTGIFALYPASSIRIMIGIFIYISCYFVMKSILVNTTQEMIHKSLTYVGILFNLGSLFFYFLGLQKVGFVLSGDRVYHYGLMLDSNYPRLIGLLQDPNFFVFYNTIFFAYFLTNARSWMNKFGLLLTITTNLLTFSRGGLLVMVCLLLVYLALNNPLRQLKTLLGLGTALLISLYVSVVYFKLDIIGVLRSRIEDFSQDGGSGRLELWGRAWNYFAENPLTGLGAYNFADYNSVEFNDDLTVHNTFLDILADAGLVGIFGYLLFLGLLLFQLIYYKVHKREPYLFLTFIGLTMQMGFLTVIINDMFFLYVAILSAYLFQSQMTDEVVISRPAHMEREGEAV
ncbi:O-antigen ligase family protein [Salimicrobium halophilum]|uniref:O-antigen ligase n=1 Tax=Salimicrobium halophilum TaxID=86666 RepID=A0A1G8SCS0_9BACI|nr:O-antigen ligase family protein [Salimicrobium halophilum]SDJ26535.1 O-antigen ligase [Salimicrobium halophilum]